MTAGWLLWALHVCTDLHSTGCPHVSGPVGNVCLEYKRTGANGPVGTTHWGTLALQRHAKPVEFCFLVDCLQGSLQKVVQMTEPTARFLPSSAQLLEVLAFQCINLATTLLPPSGGSPALVQPAREGGSSAATRRGDFPSDDAFWPLSTQTIWLCSCGQAVEAMRRGDQDWHPERVL